MEYVFRSATLQDFKQISELFRKAVEYMINNGIYQWDEIYPDDAVLLQDITREELYLLVREDTLIACVVVNEVEDEAYRAGDWKYTGGKVAVIHRLCVHPDAQGSGNGKRVLAFTEDLIKEKGYSSIRLDAFPQNEAAVRMYQSSGYRLAGEVKFRKGLFYLFEKALLI